MSSKKKKQGVRATLAGYLLGEKLSYSAKMTILLVLVVSFPVVAQILVPFVDAESIRILTVLPVIVTSAFFGAKIGLIFIIYVFVFSYVVFLALGIELELSTPNLLILTIALAIIGYVIGSASDLTREQSKLTKSLKTKESIYRVIYNSVQEYMEGGIFEQTVLNMLGRLGKNMDVSRTYLFVNNFESLEDKHPTVTQLYEWSATGVQSHAQDDQMTEFDIRKYGLLPMFKEMKKHGSVALRRSEFPKEISDVFFKQEIYAILNVPIYVKGEFWGFIGFDDTTEERNWTEEEIEVLKLVSAILGSLIVNRDASKELSENAKELQDMNDVLVGREMEMKKVKKQLTKLKKDTAQNDNSG